VNGYGANGSSVNTTKRFKNLASLLARPRPKVGATPADVVHRENKWKLLRYRPAAGVERKHKTPVLLVPSLINRHYVLDLLPGKSFVEYLVGQGHDVLLVDWGAPTAEDRYLSFDEVCDRYVGRAVRASIRAAGPASGGKVHLFGYCLGGTIAAIHATLHPESVASLTLVAAPVTFADDGLLSAWTRSPTFDVGALVGAFGNVPWPLMQAAFHMLRPTLGMSKTVSLVDRAWDDEFLDGFLALETWGNDNVSFPGEAYRRYVEELYRKDALASGTLRVGGRPARLDAIACPVLAVTFEHDNIVPWASASAVLDLVGSRRKERVHLQGGHVGAMVSKAAARGLWPQLSLFWSELDGRSKKTPSEARAPRSRRRSQSA
jgi:polyhydroxyalkanoate synthase subunit PhaC